MDCDDEMLKQTLAEETVDSPNTLSSSGSSTTSLLPTPLGTIPQHSELSKEGSYESFGFSNANELTPKKGKKPWKVVSSLLLSALLLSLFCLNAPVQNIAKSLPNMNDIMLVGVKSSFINGTGINVLESVTDVFKWDSRDQAIVNAMKSAVFNVTSEIHRVSTDAGFSEVLSTLGTYSQHANKVARNVAHAFNESYDHASQYLSSPYLLIQNSAGRFEERVYHDVTSSLERTKSEVRKALVTLRETSDYCGRQTLRHAEIAAFTFGSIEHRLAEYLAIESQFHWDSFNFDEMKNSIVSSFSSPAYSTMRSISTIAHSTREYLLIEVQHLWESFDPRDGLEQLIVSTSRLFERLLEYTSIEFQHQWESVATFLANEFHFQWDAYDQNLWDVKLCFDSSLEQERNSSLQIEAEDGVVLEEENMESTMVVGETLSHAKDTENKELESLALDHQVGKSDDVAKDAPVEEEVITFVPEVGEIHVSTYIVEQDETLEGQVDRAHAADSHEFKVHSQKAAAIVEGALEVAHKGTESEKITEDHDGVVDESRGVEKAEPCSIATIEGDHTLADDEAKTETVEGDGVVTDFQQPSAENDKEAPEASMTNAFEVTMESLEANDSLKLKLRVALPDLASQPSFFGLVRATRGSVTLYDGKLRELRRKMDSLEGEEEEPSTMEINEGVEEKVVVESEKRRPKVMGQTVRRGAGAVFSAFASFLFSILLR